jgi:hypothetical protein
MEINGYWIGLDGKRTKKTHRCGCCDKLFTKAQADKLRGECKCGGRIDHRRWFGY